MSNKPSLHVHPDFYAVYLLQSIPKPRSFYIGSTPDPVRRLNQHNGVLKAGGAYRTKNETSRPWQMALVVHGFPSSVAALQFEHAFQHPYQTRHISPEHRVSQTKSSAVSVHQKLANVRLLLNSPVFKRYNLQIIIFDDKIYHTWQQDKYKIEIPIDSQVLLTNFHQFFNKSISTSPINRPVVGFNKAKQFFLSESTHCNLCNRSIEFIPELPIDQPCFTQSNLNQLLHNDAVPLITKCECDACFHVSCLAHKFLSDSHQLIPSTVNRCPNENCHVPLYWPSVVKLATQLRAYVLQDLVNVKLTQLSQSRSQSQSQAHDVET